MSYLVWMGYGTDRRVGGNDIFAEEYDDLDEAVAAYESLDIEAEAGIWSVHKGLDEWHGEDEGPSLMYDMVKPNRPYLE